jgi:hypothetical protein
VAETNGDRPFLFLGQAKSEVRAELSWLG